MQARLHACFHRQDFWYVSAQKFVYMRMILLNTVKVPAFYIAIIQECSISIHSAWQPRFLWVYPSWFDSGTIGHLLYWLTWHLGLCRHDAQMGADRIVPSGRRGIRKVIDHINRFAVWVSPRLPCHHQKSRLLKKVLADQSPRVWDCNCLDLPCRWKYRKTSHAWDM